MYSGYVSEEIFPQKIRVSLSGTVGTMEEHIIATFRFHCKIFQSRFGISLAERSVYKGKFVLF